jgi:voltage-gated potassium channel
METAKASERDSAGHRSLDDRHGAYLLFTLALSVFAIGVLAFEVLVAVDPRTREILRYADHAVCVLFFVDFLASLYNAPEKWRYLIRWGWLDLLSSIPTFEAFRLGRAARIFRILRVLRAIRSAKILAEFILLRRAQGTFLAVALVSFLLVVVSSISILHVETDPNSNIKTAEDAVWWALTTITTVGYGDRVPVTSEGRFIGGVLMFAGVGLFATFSGFVAAWFIRPVEKKQVVDLEVLRDEIAALRRAIEAKSPPEKSDEPDSIAGAE